MAEELAEKPKLQADDPQGPGRPLRRDLRHIKVPEDSGLREGGLYLADSMKVGENTPAGHRARPVHWQVGPDRGRLCPLPEALPALPRRLRGGRRADRRVPLPRPRDYRPGIFKFTSTNPVNAKPTRADLRKTLLYGLHGTSMPGFEAIMTGSQIEQVIDYMMFLSMRGETETLPDRRGRQRQRRDAETALADTSSRRCSPRSTSSWKEAETQVVNPSARRVEPTRESVLRGRDHFLGTNTCGNKLEFVSCHGASGKGTARASSSRTIFKDVVFREWPLDQAIDRRYKVEKESGGRLARPEAERSSPTPKAWQSS